MQIHVSSNPTVMRSSRGGASILGIVSIDIFGILLNRKGHWFESNCAYSLIPPRMGIFVFGLTRYGGCEECEMIGILILGATRCNIVNFKRVYKIINSLCGFTLNGWNLMTVDIQMDIIFFNQSRSSKTLTFPSAASLLR